MHFSINRIIVPILAALLIIMAVAGWKYYNDIFEKQKMTQKTEEKRGEKMSEEEIKKREEIWKEALLKKGIKNSIPQARVLKVEKNEITVQEIYPYIDNTGKIYPIHTFVLTTSSETEYGRRIYIMKPDGLVTTNFKDEKGFFEEIRPEMFVSSMVLDDLSESKKIRAHTIVYFDRLPGVKYENEEEIKVGTK